MRKQTSLLTKRDEETFPFVNMRIMRKINFHRFRLSDKYFFFFTKLNHSAERPTQKKFPT